MKNLFKGGNGLKLLGLAVTVLGLVCDLVSGVISDKRMSAEIATEVAKALEAKK